MTKRKRRAIIIALVLAVIATWLAWDGRAVAHLRFAGNVHVPSFDADYHRLPDLLPIGQPLIDRCYRGLPHPYGDADAFVHDLWHTPNRSILGYRFYEQPETLAPQLSETIASILSRPDSYHEYGGPKLCGGYHADFAVMLNGDGKQRWFLVCLGCSEVLTRSDDGELICELEPLAHAQLRDVWSEHLGKPFTWASTRLPVAAGELGMIGYKEYRRTYGKRSFATEPSATRSRGKRPDLVSANVRGQTIFSTENMPDSDFPRFVINLSEESFATEQEAAIRAARLTDPEQPARDDGGNGRKVLKQFFVMGSRVYSVSTGKSGSEDELGRILDWFRKQCEATPLREAKQFE